MKLLVPTREVGGVPAVFRPLRIRQGAKNRPVATPGSAAGISPQAGEPVKYEVIEMTT